MLAISARMSFQHCDSMTSRNAGSSSGMPTSRSQVHQSITSLTHFGTVYSSLAPKVRIMRASFLKTLARLRSFRNDRPA